MNANYNYSPLLTDLYQLTMAYGYWRLNMHEREAVFHLLFRKNPFNTPFALSCGLASAIEFFNQWHFKDDDLNYLDTLKEKRGNKLFPIEFLDYLKTLSFTCSVDAIPEGTVIFPHLPLLRIQGPLLQCQLIESPLLNIINFQTLVATKASRVCHAARGDEVIEFGMRRAQGPDGALSASRAAYIGGCVGTSNTLAGKLFDIPVRGTHAHSWVAAFPSEIESFAAYASVMPGHCNLLVDTYHTAQGVKNAIEIGYKLREQGSDLLGVRLDSGDLAKLSQQARKLLDEAGFTEAKIIASNSLDEYVITDLKNKGAKINTWGVGTNLVTAYDHPALDGVYKLSALKDENGKWEHKLKLSEEEVKISNPGRHQVRRFFAEDNYLIDVIYDLEIGLTDNPQAVILNPELKTVDLNDYDASVDLLKPVLDKGKLIQPLENIHIIRKNAIQASEHFYRTHDERPYSVGIEKKLYDVKQKLVKKLRQ